MKTLYKTILLNKNIIRPFFLCFIIVIESLNFNAQLCSTGSIETLYNQHKSFDTRRLGNGSLLNPYNYTLNAGCMKISTFQWNGNNNNIELYDQDNNWNDSYNSVHREKMVAASAHWAATKSFEYFNSVHERIGFKGYFTSNTPDLRIVTNIPAASNSMLPTDLHTSSNGHHREHTIYCVKNSNKDWVSLDMIGRQYAKGIIQYTSKVGYDNQNNPIGTIHSESGALLESFGDIFGTMIEKSVQGSIDWQIGDDMGSNSILRNISNPNSKDHPDTYNGNYWSNSNNNYINCNVINYWFYLLAAGDGNNHLNDKQDQYNVEGIGINKAREIMYKAFTMPGYFNRTTTFQQAAIKTKQMAELLYGVGSNEANQVCNAWYAVGVGNQPCGSNNNGGVNSASLTLPNSVLRPNHFTFAINASGYQNGTLTIKIKDGNNILKIDQVLNGTSGNYTVPSTIGWAGGTCTVDLIHITSGSTIASETFTMITPSISVPNSVTKPSDFSVTYNRAGHPVAHLLIFHNGHSTPVFNQTNLNISGVVNIPSTANWSAGNYTAKLLIPGNITIVQETFTVTQNTGNGNTGNGNNVTCTNCTAIFGLVPVNVVKPAGISVNYNSTGYEAGDPFTMKIFDGNNTLKMTSTEQGTSGTFNTQQTTNYAPGNCRIELYDKDNILKDSEHFILSNAPQSATISSITSIISPLGFTFSYNSNGYASNEEFTIRVYDGNYDLKETLNRSSFTNSGNITIPSTAGYATGTCRIKIYDSNNNFKDVESFNLNAVSINSPGTVIKPNGFQFTYTTAGYNSNDNIIVRIYDNFEVLKNSWSHVGDANVTVPQGNAQGNANYAFGNIANGLGTWTIPSTLNYNEGTCKIKILANGVLVDSVTWTLEEQVVNSCNSYGAHSDSLFIDKVEFGNIINPSGNNNGYADYSDLMTVLSDSLEISLKPGFVTEITRQDIYWNVWIDFNNDGDFDDNNELAFEGEQKKFLRGDANQDGNINMSDMIFINNVLFQGIGSFSYPDAADVNDDGEINISDVIYLSNYLYSGSIQSLPEPFLIPGFDFTADNLGDYVMKAKIYLPTNVVDGNTKMRIQLKAGSYTSNACESYVLGEVEDYSIEILDLRNESFSINESPINITKEINRELSINTFPNPSNGIINVAVKGDLDDGFRYRVINLSGQIVEEGKETYKRQLKLDLSDRMSGIYLVEVQTTEKKISKRVVIN